MSDWSELISRLNKCRSCQLGETRTNIVVGRGSRNAPVMLIGEGPGEQEDIQGLPFVGAAGQLLDALLSALCFTVNDYYIANIVKCRPPGNRLPSPEEAEACLPFLREQTRLIKPLIIVCMGATAAKYIIDRGARISEIRGEWVKRGSYMLMPTFHPAALLRDTSKKPLMFNDFKKVRAKLDEIKKAKAKLTVS